MRILLITEILDVSSPTSVPSDRAVRAARKNIDALLGTRQLSEPGLGWLVTTLDPFHDTELVLQGYPDQISARSVCQTYQKKVTITAPAAAAGGAWDAHISFMPHASPALSTWALRGLRPAGDLTTPTAGFVIDDTAGTNNGGVVVRTGAAGVPTWSLTGAAAVQKVDPAAAVVRFPVIAEGHRLLAAAYEVTNTTSALYRGGDVTIYKQPLMPSDSTVYSLSSPSAVNQICNGTVMSLPPSSVAEAALYPNARVWGAEEGCYVVLPMNDLQQTPSRLQSRGVFYAATSAPDANIDVYGSGLSTTAGSRAFTQNNVYPFDNSGAYFTGLSNQTTLTITVRYVFERFPSLTLDSDDANFLTLATPSPPWDPLAIELYGRAMERMPPGVPVHENGLGDWFSKVVSWIGEAAPVVGNIVGNFVPGASAIGQTIGGVAKAAGGTLQSPSPMAHRQSEPPVPHSSSSTLKSVRRGEGKPKKKKR